MHYNEKLIPLFPLYQQGESILFGKWIFAGIGVDFWYLKMKPSAHISIQWAFFLEIWAISSHISSAWWKKPTRRFSAGKADTSIFRWKSRHVDFSLEKPIRRFSVEKPTRRFLVEKADTSGLKFFLY